MISALPSSLPASARSSFVLTWPQAYFGANAQRLAASIPPEDFSTTWRSTLRDLLAKTEHADLAKTSPSAVSATNRARKSARLANSQSRTSACRTAIELARAQRTVNRALDNYVRSRETPEADMSGTLSQRMLQCMHDNTAVNECRAVPNERIAGASEHNATANERIAATTERMVC
nr:hypothetical protein CFP56_78962 [Quercus suber]